MAAPIVYRSTDTSAPVLSGSLGAAITVLDACLRTGYGSKPGAGWTKPFTGTNTASFRQGGGNGFYLDVNDTGPGLGTTREGRMFGYETMSAVGTGTGSFPTTVQLSSGIILRKSSVADTSPRVWTIIADDRTFYFFIQTNDSSNPWFCFGFGDFYSYLAGTDGYRTFIMGRVTENLGTISLENADKVSASFTAIAGHYCPRSYTGLGGSFQASKAGDTGKTNMSVLAGQIAIPHPVDGKIWIAPVFWAESALIIRGKMRGFMHLLHNVAGFADQDTVTGAGVYSGRTFLLFKTTGNAAVYCIDITGPWDAN